jgi:hypothetical protein
MKSGILNLLEPPGPVQACNGIALTLPIRIVEDVYERAKMLRGSFIAFIVVTIPMCWATDLQLSPQRQTSDTKAASSPLETGWPECEAYVSSLSALSYVFFTNRVKNVETASKIVFTPSRKNAFHCTDFHKS